LREELIDNEFIRAILDEPVYVHVDDQPALDSFLLKIARYRDDNQGNAWVQIYLAPGHVRSTAGFLGVAALRGRDLLEITRGCAVQIELPRQSSIVLTAADIDAMLQAYTSGWPRSRLGEDTDFSGHSINCLIGVLGAHLVERQEVSAAYLSTGLGLGKTLLIEIFAPLAYAIGEVAVALHAIESAARDVSSLTPFTVILVARASDMPTTFLPTSRSKIYQRI
jgi:hypothetical protein